MRLPASMRAADDTAVLAHAAAEHRVLVTLDTDFGALVLLHGRPPRLLADDIDVKNTR